MSWNELMLMRCPATVWTRPVLLILVLAALGLVLPAAAPGQDAASPHPVLVRAWAAHIQVDPNQGAVEHWVQHVSRNRYFTVYRVANQGRDVYFSEQAVDGVGQLMGPEGARRQAENRALELRERGGSPEITELRVPQATLYVQTTSGALQAIDAHTGHTRWVVQIGRPFHPSVPPAADDDMVAAVSGTKLALLAADTGQALYQRSSGSVPSAGLAMDARFIYMPTTNGKIEAYDRTDRLGATPWRFAVSGVAKSPALPTGGAVMWGTSGGKLYSVDPANSEMLFTSDVGAPIAATPAMLDPDTVVVITETGLVYALDRKLGTVVWRESVGDNVDFGPLVDQQVYVVTRRTGVAALDGATGEQLWRVAGVKHLLSLSPTRLFAISNDARIVAIDRRTGALQVMARAGRVDLMMSNTMTDRVFVGTRRGEVICVREADAVWPHVRLPAIETPAAPATPSGSASPGAARVPRAGDADASSASTAVPAEDADADAALAPPEDDATDLDADDELPMDDDPFGGAAGDPFAE